MPEIAMVTDLQRRLERLETKVDAGFERLENQFLSLYTNGPISRLKEQVAKIESEVGRLDSAVSRCIQCPNSSRLDELSDMVIWHDQFLKWFLRVGGIIAASGLLAGIGWVLMTILEH